MKGSIALVTTVLVALFSNVLASRLVHEQVETFVRILRDGFGRKEVDVEGIVQLMHLMDGNPKYNKAALQMIAHKLGQRSLSFDAFEKIIEAIYGDQISEDPFQPQEVHLALGNDINTMKVQWVTMSSLQNPIVEYTTNANCATWSDVHTSTAISYTYTVPQNWWPVFNGLIYEADMTNLSPDTSYCYRVGGYDSVNATTRVSKFFTFTTAPVPSPTHTTRIGTLADHGTFMLLGFETIDRMVALKDTLDLDFVFAAGDLAYAGLSSEMKALNISKEDEFEHVWDLLHIQNEPIAANVPWMVGNGNHERFYNWTAFTNRYKMPASPSSNGNFWYSFVYGNVRWISLSSEHPLDAESEQIAFLTSTLQQAQAERKTTPWIIFTLHKPLYCSVEGSPHFADELEALLLEYDVDLTLTGHMHAYERIHPVKAGEVTVSPQKLPWGANADSAAEGKVLGKLGLVDVYYSSGAGPVHVMQGHAGGMQVERWSYPIPAWSGFRMANGIVMPNVNYTHPYGDDVVYDLSDYSKQLPEDIETLSLFPLKVPDDLLNGNFNYSHTYGFGYITAFNHTHLLYQAVPNIDGERNHDEFWIVKKH